ncbi:hypothetical protein BACCAP_03170 [Pseudoflavonifractor capillosus ATCC 29799]|uniref:Uncharacterized protein n=1 Tax=Pseudoflavonifractor capillosus ATCC 29799 TaxID=411467 RepID=A6NY71_9FIRM|nr:hypothetical protein BACCAP_03170 [Pseudoflavonifractor capillosus ATCC 29799]
MDDNAVTSTVEDGALLWRSSTQAERLLRLFFRSE